MRGRTVVSKCNISSCNANVLTSITLNKFHSLGVKHFSNSMQLHLFWHFRLRGRSLMKCRSFAEYLDSCCFFCHAFGIGWLGYIAFIFPIVPSICTIIIGPKITWDLALEMRLPIYTHTQNQTETFEGSHITKIVASFFSLHYKFSRFVFRLQCNGQCSATCDRISVHTFKHWHTFF